VAGEKQEKKKNKKTLAKGSWNTWNRANVYPPEEEGRQLLSLIRGAEGRGEKASKRDTLKGTATMREEKKKKGNEKKIDIRRGEGTFHRFSSLPSFLRKGRKPTSQRIQRKALGAIRGIE